MRRHCFAIAPELAEDRGEKFEVNGILRSARYGHRLRFQRIGNPAEADLALCRLVKRSGTTDTPLLYNGKYGVMTDANGLCYMRARYYNPYLRRFINADPCGLAGGLNLYALEPDRFKLLQRGRAQLSAEVHAS